MFRADFSIHVYVNFVMGGEENASTKIIMRPVGRMSTIVFSGLTEVLQSARLAIIYSATFPSICLHSHLRDKRSRKL